MLTVSHSNLSLFNNWNATNDSLAWTTHEQKHSAQPTNATTIHSKSAFNISQIHTYTHTYCIGLWPTFEYDFGWSRGDSHIDWIGCRNRWGDCQEEYSQGGNALCSGGYRGSSFSAPSNDVVAAVRIIPHMAMMTSSLPYVGHMRIIRRWWFYGQFELKLATNQPNKSKNHNLHAIFLHVVATDNDVTTYE